MKFRINITALMAFVLMLLIIACKDNEAEMPEALPGGAYYGWAVGDNDKQQGLILHTRDGGKTWERQAAESPLFAIMDIQIFDPRTLLIVGTDPGKGVPAVRKSIDGGESWVQTGNGALALTNYNGIYNLNDDHIFIVGDSGRLYRSDDMAMSWKEIELPAQYDSCIFYRVAAASPDDIWVVGDHLSADSTPVMLHTTDGGITWTRPDPVKALDIEAAIGGHHLAIKLFGNSIWAMGGFGGFIVRSTDEGANWTNVSVPNAPLVDANDIFLLSETKAFAAYDFGGVYSTSDGGNNWTKYHPPSSNYLTGIALLDEVHLWVCGVPAYAGVVTQILYSEDAGTTWENQTPQIMHDSAGFGLYKIRFTKVE